MSLNNMQSLILSPSDQYQNSTIEPYTNISASLNFFSTYSNIHRLVIRCFSLYALLLVIIGTLGNTITIIVLCRRNLRRFVTMRYLIAVSVCDTITLYGWNFNNFYKFTISPKHTNFEEISLAHCRVVSYLTFVGLQLSSWYLAAVSIDRCLSLYFLNWKQKYGKLSRTKYYIGILTIACLLLNSHVLFLNGYQSGPPHFKVSCYKTRTNPYYIFPQWERIHLIVYNLFPFIIMLACNTYIIQITIRSARIRTVRTKGPRGNRMNSTTYRHRQLSFMLILVTFVFVLLTLPSCIYFVFFRHHMSPKRYSRTYRHMIQICLSSIQFTSHAINFFLYCFSARNFRSELGDFVKEICIYRLVAFIRGKSTSLPSSTRSTAFRPKNRNAKKSHSEHALEYQEAEC